jgi:hypothetical protein
MKSLIKKILKEEAYINKHGGLHDFSFGVYYPFDEMTPMIEWFLSEYGEQIQAQGWSIFQSNQTYPLRKYDDKNKGFWQIEKIDDVDSWASDTGIPTFDLVKSDMEADIKAKELGLIVDDYGVIQGYGDHNYVDEYNE